MQLKVCGMKYNIQEVAALQPDYLGFIFYEKSPRDVTNHTILKTPTNIKKVGVFVNTSIDFILSKISQHQLDIIQLHGDETIDFITALKAQLKHQTQINLWKVFGIKDTFNFELLTPFENQVDAFLFDTKGKQKGGNGYAFDWSILKNYPSKTPFVLSGGIGLDQIEEVKKILTTKLPILALDVNSKFEIEPGLKNITDIKKFRTALQL